MDTATLTYIGVWCVAIVAMSVCLWRIKRRERIEAREREQLRQKYRDDGEDTHG